MATIADMEPTSPVRIKTKLVNAARKAAKEDKRTIQGTVELALEEFLERRKARRAD